MVVESEVGHVSSIDCLQVVSQLEKSMAKTAAEELIARLDKDGWLETVRECLFFKDMEGVGGGEILCRCATS